MRTILASFLIFLLFLPVSAIGEIQTITHIVKQPFGGSQSADDARIAAIAKAKREALEMAGVYVEALTIVKDAKVDKDEILALTAGVLKSEVISQKNYVAGEGFGIEIVVKIIVDPSVLEGRVKKLLQDRTHLEQLNQARKKEKELLEKMAILEKENRLLMAKKESSKDLQKQFEGVSQELTAVDWSDRAIVLWDGGKYTDPHKAIEYLNQAIRLQPDYAGAYLHRGVAYLGLDLDQRAISDFNEAIHLKPDYEYAYVNRGAVYAKIEQYQQAISDYNEAIRLDRNDPVAYNNRGVTYYHLAQDQLAINDYDEAIRLKPDYEYAYNNKGLVYARQKQDQIAIEYYSEAIRLKSDYAEAYVNRGMAYSRLKHYQRAIDDYNQVIRLKPDYALAYFERGSAYDSLGQDQRAIDDYKKAILINPKDALTCALAWNNIAVAYNRSGNRPAALDAVRELRRLKPALADSLFNLIMAR